MTYSNSLQAAVNAASVNLEDNSVYIPSGTYVLEKTVAVPSNVTLKGDGKDTILIGNPSVLTHYVMLQVTGSNVTIEDITLDGGGATNITPLSLGNGNKTYTNLTIQRIKLTRATHNGIRMSTGVFKSITIQECEFTNTNEGISFQPSNRGCENIVISNNSFTAVGSDSGGIAIQLFTDYNDINSRDDVFTNVQINGNIFSNFHPEALPIEPSGCKNISISNNILTGPGKRGISTARCRGMVISGNRITNQSIYAIELNGGNDISIIGNMVEGCTSFAQASNVLEYPVNDVLISSNVIRNNGYNTSGTSNSIYMRNGAKRWTITGNTFYNVKTAPVAAAAQVIRIGTDPSTAGAVVSNNVYYCDRADSVLTFVSVPYGSQHVIKGNQILINRPVTTAANSLACIYLGNVPDMVVQDNTIMVKSNTSTTFTGVGNPDPTTFSAVNVSITGNVVQGFKNGYAVLTRNTAPDKIISGNVIT